MHVDIAVVVYDEMPSATKRIHNHNRPESFGKRNATVVYVGSKRSRSFTCGLTTGGQKQNSEKELQSLHHWG